MPDFTFEIKHTRHDWQPTDVWVEEIATRLFGGVRYRRASSYWQSTGAYHKLAEQPWTCMESEHAHDIYQRCSCGNATFTLTTWSARCTACARDISTE